MFGNIMGALFFVVVALLPRIRKVELCSVDEGGVLPYIWDRCSCPDLFRGQRPANNNVIWGVTYPATYVKGEKFPFIGEDLGLWSADHKFVEICQYGSPANCVIPPPCTSTHMLCISAPSTTEEELPIVGFFARWGCEDADEVEEQPKVEGMRRPMDTTHVDRRGMTYHVQYDNDLDTGPLLPGWEWVGGIQVQVTAWKKVYSSKRWEKQRSEDRRLGRRIKAEVLGC